MLKGIKENQLIFKTVWFFRGLAGITPEKLNRQYHQRNAPKLIQTYLQNHAVRKLQIGAQSNSVGGWLNVDIEPKSREVAFMDATEPFPFPDETFDYIFSEHMIEHITFSQGCFMLRECFRVLKKGGVVRISTPNLQFLINLYQSPEQPIHSAYVKESVKRYFSTPVPVMNTIVINNFFRDWGHQFIHDDKSLGYVLQQAGFNTITRCQVGISHHTQLHNLEQHDKEIGTEFNKLESIVFEAIK